MAYSCPLVSVRNGRDIYVTMSPTSPLWSRNVSGCINALGGGFSRRLLTVLRMLRRTLKVRRIRNDFAFRLCVDDTCHGLVEQAGPVPLFTMTSCETARTIPAIQWNTAGLRDPDLSVWDRVRAELRETSPTRREHSSWAMRSSRAVWRGSLHEPFVTNGNWTPHGHLARSHIGSDTWKLQGRLALFHQQCLHPDLFDVRIIEGLRLLHIDDAEYHACLQQQQLRQQKQTEHIPLQTQADSYKYVVHVEGHPGWADRLKHLLLSGMLVLKQDMGVKEFYEPMFRPWEHYVPIDSTLSNLSAAVRWARREDAAAHAMALRAASRADEVLSEAALATYQEELFVQYATLFRDGAAELAAYRTKHVAHTANFGCEERDEARGIDCFFVRRGIAGARTEVSMRRGSMRDARRTRLTTEQGGTS